MLNNGDHAMIALRKDLPQGFGALITDFSVLKEEEEELRRGESGNLGGLVEPSASPKVSKQTSELGPR